MSSDTHTQGAYDCESLQALIPDYAFGLTSAEETRLVEAHLADCPEAVAQLADYRRMQTDLRAGVPQIEPPPALEAKLMAAIAPPAISIPKPQHKPFPIMPLAAAAALIALVFTNVYWMTRVNDLTARQDELAAQLSQQDSVPVLTNASDLRSVRLPPSQDNSEASAYLFWNAESETGLLYVRGFPALSADKTYQLWLTRGEVRVSATTFQVDEDGSATVIFHMTEPIDEYTWARVTAEPHNGSVTPGENIVVLGEL